MPTSKKIGFAITGLLMVAGLAAWGLQLKEGLVLTNMRNSYTWGLYVSTLAFFVGNAAGGLVLSSMIYLFGATSLKPFAKIGALCAFANVTAAMFAVIPDIGRPIRLYNMLLHPQWRSPLVWDVIVLNLYAGLSLLYLYILMFPNFKGPLKRLALKVDHPQQFSEKWARRLAPVSLVSAVGIHVVTAWIFATQGARDWWNSAVLAPDFVAAALASGTAIVLIVCVLTYGIKEPYTQPYRSLAIFISVAYFIHIFFMYNDFFIHYWYGATEALEVLAVTFKDYALAHAFEVIAPLAGVVLLLNSKMRKSAAIMIAACLLVVAGIFAHRFLLMPAAFDRVPLTIAPLGIQNSQWPVPIASGSYQPLGDTFVTQWHYFPSAIEIAIFGGVVAFTCFLILLAVDRLPIVNKDKVNA